MGTMVYSLFWVMQDFYHQPQPMDVHSWGKEHQRVIRRTSTQIAQIECTTFQKHAAVASTKEADTRTMQAHLASFLTKRVHICYQYGNKSPDPYQGWPLWDLLPQWQDMWNICICVYIYIYLFISVCVLCMYGPSGFWSPHSKPHPDPQKQVK